jgi:hypothetical protein
MNTYKFSLANVIAILTGVAFGFVCFLGANFYTLGDTKKSLIYAGIITFILVSLAFLAKWLKGAKSNFKISFVGEVISLILFTGAILIFTYSPFSHFFTVTDKQDDIRSELSTAITNTQDMFSAYDDYAKARIALYNSTLKSIVNANDKKALKQYGFVKKFSTETQLDNKMETIQTDLFPSNYTGTNTSNGIKEVAQDWLSDAQEKTKGWKPIGIVGVVNDIQEKSIGWRNNLIDYSKMLQKGQKPANFNYNLSSFDGVKAKFTSREKPTLLAMGLGLLAWLLMLLSWYITKPDIKNDIRHFRRLAPYEIEL